MGQSRAGWAPAEGSCAVCVLLQPLDVHLARKGIVSSCRPLPSPEETRVQKGLLAAPSARPRAPCRFWG